MSLVFTNTPVDFQPVLADGLFFTLSADTTDKFKFRYVYELYVEDNLVFGGKATPNPYGLGIVDLQQILETYCYNNPISLWDTTPIYTHQTFPFSRPYSDEVINYYIRAGYEYADSALGIITGFTGIGTLVGTPAYQSDVYKIFRSTMGTNGRATQQDFNIGPFVLSGSPIGQDPTTSGLFLTNSPRIRNIDPSEYYTLAFTNYYLSQNTGTTLSEPYYVEFNFYDNQGSLIDTHTYDNIVSNGGGPRTDCNNVYQQLYLIDPASGTTDYNTLYVGAGPENISGFPSNTQYYTVQLFGKFTGTTTPIPVSPTPTPTQSPGAVSSTPTPTPTTTPYCVGCTTYQLIYTGDCESVASVTFINCATGLNQTIKLNCGVYYEICACSAPFTPPDVEITGLGSCIPIPTPTPTPTLTRTLTPTPSTIIYNYLGRTTPDQGSGPNACANYLTIRSYSGLKPLASMTIGDIIYDTYPSSPTNGGGNWVALKVGGAGQGYAFQIDTDGTILDTYTC